MMKILSLGAGVQSTTMALMAAHGEIERPDCAIFADTGWEPRKVYEHLEWLTRQVHNHFPVHVVSAGNILSDIDLVLEGKAIRGMGRAATAPFFAIGKDGKGAPLRRQCTNHYKIEPINAKLREMLGLKPRQRLPKTPVVQVLIGISMDEIYRMKPAQEAWIERQWPLIDKRMTRSDCLLWMERNGYPTPPKSSCVGCPYHSDAEWRRIRDEAPVEFSEAVALDKRIRGGFGGTRSKLFLHRSLKPLDEVDLSTAEERGQGNLFNNECEGMCGV